MEVSWDAHLDIILCKLASQPPPRSGHGINSVVDGNLAILMIEELIDILATLFRDFLSKQDRWCRCYGRVRQDRECSR